MKDTKVIVVTDVEAGWDCVSGVFLSLKDAVENWGLQFIEGKYPHTYDVPNRHLIFHEEVVR